MKKIYILFINLIFGLSIFAQPIANFEADDIAPSITQAVNFRNLSTGADIYEWSFNPSTVTFIVGNQYSSNPTVLFNEAVNYTVTLVATNSFSGLSDTETKTDYIIIAPYQIGIRQNPSTLYVEVQIRFNEGPLPGPSNKIEDIQFGITWDRSVVNGNKVDIDLVCDNDNNYNLMQEDHPLPWNYGGNGGWDCRNFVLINGQTPFHPPVNWITGKWFTIAKLKIYPRTPGQIAEVGVMWTVPSDDYFGNANWDINPIMVVNGTTCNLGILPEEDNMNAVPLPIPTNLHGYVWVGGNGGINDPNNEFDDYSWNHAANWVTECGGEDSYATQPPGIYDDCYIPNVDVEVGGSGCYPRYPKPSNPSEEIATGQDIAIDDGGRIEWMFNKSSASRVKLVTQGNLNIGESSNISIYLDGELDIGGDSAWVANLNIFDNEGVKIKSGGWVNSKYRTFIKNSTALVIEADEYGVGSFVNTGKVIYENGGTVKVETYISGFENVYHMHLAGPTVKDVAYENTGLTGVRLEQFNMTILDTYAYEWSPLYDIEIVDESLHLYHGWINVWPFEYNVKVANGLAITNWEAGSGTMNMIGFLNADTANAIQYQVFCAEPSIDNQLELLSNPFSSAIDFNELYIYESNSDLILGKYWIWNDDYGNYEGEVNGLSNGYIQVGQGFFVKTLASGTLEFPASIRTHSTVAFREIIPNKLDLVVEGGGTTYKDRLTLYFDHEATSSFDENLELEKWNSIREDATMIRSIADDGTELAINALDAKKYYKEEVVSVPVHFQCGYDGTYTFDFSGIDSFDPGAEIWLEDKLVNQNNIGERSSVKITEDNHMYSFTASPDDAYDRFVIHFFGPSYLPNAVDENNAAEKIKIYSSGNSVYILNKSDEEIKEMSAYNMIGQEILRSKVPMQDLNKIDLNMTTGYYAVRVLTDKNIYSEKVFIKAY
jgi:hypothetical protein